MYWLMKFVIIGPILKLFWRPRVEGLENLPKDGAAILASNHLSFSDSFFLPLVCPRRVTFLAKAEYFNTPGLKGKLSKFFFTSVGQVPIERDDADAAQGALNTGVKILKAGKFLGIYPEGTRSPDGRLYKGKTGVARMALEANVPVIPVAMIDTHKVQPTGRMFPKLGVRPGVRFGTPLDFSRYDGLSGDRFVERSMTDEIMYDLMQLSGQEYVDQYAAKIKKQTGADLGFGAAEKPRSRSGITRPDAVGETSDDRLPAERAG